MRAPRGAALRRLDGAVRRRALLAATLLGCALQLAMMPGGGVRADAQESAAARSSPAPLPPLPAHVRRGDEVDARYRAYRDRLERFHSRLGSDLRDEASDLYAKLMAAPPAPLQYGYQILPKLVPDPPRRDTSARAVSNSFGWRHTEAFIERDLPRLEKLETTLEEAPRMTPEQRRRERETMVSEYLALAEKRKLIETNIQYNRLWQGEIHRLRAEYDAATVLHDAVMERQAILDAFLAGDDLPSSDLVEQEQALFRQIRERVEGIARPPFVRVERPEPHRWIVRVPVYTDIEDQPFVESFQKAVENAWRVDDGRDEFRVLMEIRRLTASQLYAPGSPPKPGEPIDLDAHVTRFPAGGAVLTTGAALTHVGARWSINLGPHDIAPNVLAHEFGHILGLPDGYFRGYRDRGSEGYEVLEVVPDLTDIMSAPGFGRVSRHHFERILGR